MDEERLRELLLQVQTGASSVDAAIESLKDLPFEDLGFAKLDTHRQLRRGFPEVVFGQGKTADQVLAIVEALQAHHNVVLATRLTSDATTALKARFPDGAYF